MKSKIILKLLVYHFKHNKKRTIYPPQVLHFLSFQLIIMST